MSLSLLIDNKGKDILVLGTGPTQELNHMLETEPQYSINFRRSDIKFCFWGHLGLLINIVNASNHTKCVLLRNHKLLLLIYTLMNTVANFTAINIQLN